MAFNTNYALAGVTSEDTSVPSAGVYFVRGKLQAPTLSQGASANNDVVVTITNRTGPATLYTGAAGAEGFYVSTLCAAGDVLRVAVTSSAGLANPNDCKCEVSIGSGV